MILIFKLQDGSEHVLELPIVGNVLKQNSVLTELQYRPQKFDPWMIASPAITIGVNQFTMEEPKGNLVLKSMFVEQRLIIENTFNTTLKCFDVVFQDNSVFIFTY